MLCGGTDNVTGMEGLEDEDARWGLGVRTRVLSWMRPRPQMPEQSRPRHVRQLGADDAAGIGGVGQRVRHARQRTGRARGLATSAICAGHPILLQAVPELRHDQLSRSWWGRGRPWRGGDTGGGCACRRVRESCGGAANAAGGPHRHSSVVRVCIAVGGLAVACEGGCQASGTMRSIGSNLQVGSRRDRGWQVPPVARAASVWPAVDAALKAAPEHSRV